MQVATEAVGNMTLRSVGTMAGLAPTLVSPSETLPEIEMIRDMDADVSSTITDGHILDVPF